MRLKWDRITPSDGNRFPGSLDAKVVFEKHAGDKHERTEKEMLMFSANIQEHFK